MRKRRHHNNKGLRRIKSGSLHKDVDRMSKRILRKSRPLEVSNATVNKCTLTAKLKGDDYRA